VDDTVGTKFTGYQALQAATADGDIVAGVPCDLTDGGAGTASEVVTTTNVIAPAEDGSTFFLNSATGFVSTLPPPVLGARFTFVVSTAPTSGNHTVVTDSSANIIFGVIVTAQDAGGSTTNTASGDTVSFVANKSLKGDRVTFVSDGTNWFASGVSKVFDGVTITQAT
jgi:hypothetical protein